MVPIEPFKKRVKGSLKINTIQNTSSEDCLQKRLHNLMRVYCNNTKKMYLVDTGASVSVMPKGGNDKVDESFKLRAANGTVIKTYGSAQVKLDLGIKVPMEHEFIKADVSEGVIGADFIIKHGIIINLHAGQLTHGSSGQKIQVKSHAKCSIYAISKLHCERAEKLLEKHKELIYVVIYKT